MADEADEPTTIDYDGAVAMLPDGERIHTFREAGTLLLGADMSRERALQLLREAPEILLTGPEAQAMRHGLAVDSDGILFIETKSSEDTDGG